MWKVQFNKPNFKQDRCFPPNAEVIMFKVRQTFKAPIESVFVVSILQNYRRLWDTKLNDFKELYMTPDYSYGRVYYNFKSPFKGIINDRDFYLLQAVRRDFPEKGDIAIVTKSLPAHPECPIIRDKIRAQTHIVAFIYRPVVDKASGEQWTEVFMVSCIDINGDVPKFFINNFSASVPRENFAEFEAASIAHSKGSLRL